MKRLKIAILISLILGALTLFVGCGKGEDLAAPKQLDYNIENELSWSPVENARGYYVEIINVATGEDQSKEVKRTSTKISLSFLAEGDYEIRVKAVSKDEDAKTKWSETIHFQKGYETGCVYTLINDDTEYRLARYGSAPATIYIEDVYRNKPVTEIGQRAFKGYAVIENVEIGDNVRIIGDNAFYGCRNLKTVTLGESVSEIGVSAFQSCNQLASITLNEGLTTIESSAFTYCRALTSIAFPSTLQSIGSHSFSDCSALEEVVLPDTLTSLGGAAFEANTSLKKLTISGGLTEIPTGAFARCQSLETVSFPEGNLLKTIGGNAFRDCFKLASITIPEGVETIMASAFYMKVLEEWDEDDNVTLKLQSALNEVKLPTTIKGIGLDAFYGTKIYMDQLLTDVAQYVYVGDWVLNATASLKSSLEELTYDSFKEGTYGIADGALKGCQSLIKVFLPDSIRYLGNGCLQVNEKIRIFETTEDSKLETVGAYALAGCQILTEVMLRGSKVKTLEEGAFAGCGRLDNTEENILTPKSLTKVGKDAFANTKLATEGIDASGIIYAGNWLVGYNPAATITSVEVREDTAGISDYALANCEDLASLKFAEAGELKHIGRGAFFRCMQLDLLDLSFTNVRRIEDYTFYACTSLSSVELPRLTSIGRAAFYNCMELNKINLSYAVVTTIGKNAFAGCINLETVDLGNSLTDIGEGAFYQCSGLKEIRFPGTLTSIADYAFFACQGLKEVTFGSQITKIGNCAFVGCTQIKTLSFSGALKEIGDYAFYDCKELLTVRLNDGLESIGDYAFLGAEKLVEMKLPGTLKSIGDYAFAYNGALKMILLDSAELSLGESVFYACDKLTVYTTAESLPKSWKTWWNSSFCPVLWGCMVSKDDKGSYVTSIKAGETWIENAWLPDSLSAPERFGYKFLGWATSEGGEVSYSTAEIVNVESGTTLYAVWVED